MDSPPRDLASCPRIEAGFALLGKRWTGMVVAVLLQRDARFSELAHAIPGISERMLAERLRELEEAGIVEREVDAGPPVRVSYALTERGRGLEPVIDAIRDWVAAPDA